MHNLLKDLRLGARLIRKDPGASSISVLALGFGIGLTTMMFSIIYGALLRGLPVPEPDAVVHIERTRLSEGVESMEATIHDLADWKAQQRSFVAMSGLYTGTINLTGPDGPERYDGGFVDADLFDVLQVRPALGRAFTQEEDRPDAAAVVLLGHTVWRDRFASDPAIIGTSIKVMGRVVTVIGVMPDGFHFPETEDVWLPLAADPLRVPRGEGQTLEVFARLRPGVTIDQANADLASIARRLELEHPATNEGVGTVVKPVIEEFIGDEPRALLYTMLGAVFLILVIACANVANLLLSRAAVRAKEVGIRSALGASRWRLIVQFLSESLVLAIGGAVLGTGIAWLGITLFNRAIADTQPPYWIDIRLDPVALGWITAVTLVAGFIAGTLPALQASRANVGEILKDESRGSSSFRIGRVSRGLVVVEIALSCGLLVGAGLMIKSVTNLRTLEFPFHTTNVFTARIGLPEIEYPDSLRRAALYETLLPRLGSIPGVQAVALTSGLPGLWSGGTSLEIEGESYASPRDYPDANQAAIAPGFFQTFGAELSAGRDFGSQDRHGALPVATVNRSFAVKFFEGREPLGLRVRTGGPENPGPWRTIVGVVPDLYMAGIENEEPAGLYIPVAQTGARFMSIAARTQGAPNLLGPQVREAIRSIDPDLPIYFVQPLDEAIRANNWHYGVFGGLFMVFGAVALFLAAVGLYGVMSFAVSRRTREVGVRMALGAEARDVLRLILRQGMVQLAVGMVLGLGLAFGLGRLLAMALFDVQPYDPAVFTAISAVLASAALTACLVPALRATRVTPVEALRAE
ncbi:MAG: ABC transporter permease [Longimicrobiales bacterium]